MDPRIFDVMERETVLQDRRVMLVAVNKLRPPAYSTGSLASLIAVLAGRHDDVRLRAVSLIGMLGRTPVPPWPT